MYRVAMIVAACCALIVSVVPRYSAAADQDVRQILAKLSPADIAALRAALSIPPPTTQQVPSVQAGGPTTAELIAATQQAAAQNNQRSSQGCGKK